MILIHSLASHDVGRVCLRDMASVGVARVTRKVSAGNFQTDPVAFAEDITGISCLDNKLISLSRHKKSGVYQRLAETGTKNSIRQVDRGPIGRHVNKLGSPIGVRGATRCK